MIWILGLWTTLLGAKKITPPANPVSKKKDLSLPSKGKSALFVGDSHTIASPSWAEAIKAKFGLGSIAKVAANGKPTSWMLTNLQAYLAKNKAPDYIFIWGGTNDAYGSTKIDDITKNIQAMVTLGKSKGSRVIVVQGYAPYNVSYNFDLSKMYTGATQSSLINGRNRVIELQKNNQSKIKNADVIVPPYANFKRTDSTDGIHLKMPNYKILGEYIGKQTFS
jgi:lysophospholipase L1-like esterase